MELSPKQIVSELDRFIIGQNGAKRAVANALRNRYRRSKLSEELRDEITPKNIIMKGPTGCGKTEIARRLAKLVKAPFVKVEATKFTEVGYVGRDVESMVRDLVEASIRLVKNEKFSEVKARAEAIANERIAQAMLPALKAQHSETPEEVLKQRLMTDLVSGKLDNEQIEIEVVIEQKSMPIMPGMGGVEINIGEMLGEMMPKRKKRKKLKVTDARKIFTNEESNRLIDNDSVNTEALRRAEQDGIIFIDEIDKVAGKGNNNGADVSREGVQRDILPIVEGSTVPTKYGNIKTDYILFIAAGAFHLSSVKDLIPELQGRFPVIVELSSLEKADFIKILTDTENSLIKQYTALMGVDNIKLNFTEDAIDEISEVAVYENKNVENIGARRLHTIMETLIEDISFNATGDHPVIEIEINREYVKEHLKDAIAEIKNKTAPKIGFYEA
ncbi:MAG: ATP-dependent protease ATPase subunit HslU [Clostridia bacterium]|nr:ATP-dependent protease ATPase subunit HslU [Clostridia bacterium]